MTSKDERWLKEWEKWKERGKMRYVLIIGTTWAILSCVFARLFEVFTTDMSIAEIYFSTDFLIYLGCFLVAGVFFGLTMWVISERKYKKLTTSS